MIAGYHSERSWVVGRTREQQAEAARLDAATGTPIELADANTRAVFGGYISGYDIQRSASDA